MVRSTDHPQVICTHKLTEWCDCIPPRKPVYTSEGHRASWLLKRELGACTCEPTNKHHVNGYECIKPEVVAILRQFNPQAASILSERSQKRLSWMWLWFSQDGEAKQLSGRA